MMIAGLSRVSAPGLLLFVTTTTPTVLQRAHGASYITSSELGYLTDDLVDACGEEILSCREDDTCASCIDLDGENQADFEACTAALGVDDDDAESSALSCTELMALPCCREEASTLDCLENDLFVDANLCFLGMHDCGEDGITCDGVTVVGESADATDTDAAADDSAESTSNGASAAAVVFGHAWTAAAAAASSCSLFVLLRSPPLWA